MALTRTYWSLDVLLKNERTRAHIRVLHKWMLVDRGRIDVCEDVLGQDPDQRVAEALPIRKATFGTGQRDLERVVIRRLKPLNRISFSISVRLGAENLAQLVVLGRADFGPERQRVGEHHVLRREGRSVAPVHVLAQMKGELGGVIGDFIRFGQIGDQVVTRHRSESAG